MNAIKSFFKESTKVNDDLCYSISDKVLSEFLNGIDITINFKGEMTPEDKLINLLQQYIYGSEYVDYFFKILAKYDYNMKCEIRDAMFNLGNLKNPNKNEKTIKKLLNSPCIDDISFNGKNEFTISSEQYGNFTFELASYYFRENKRVARYIRRAELPQYCHHHTYFMSKLFPDFYAITSLCGHYFDGTTFYHSYTYDKATNTIIDLSANAVVDKDSYYNILQPKEISCILNSEVIRELILTTLKTSQPLNWYAMLKIALYKEYLSSINYQGNLKDAPSLRRFKK